MFGFKKKSKSVKLNAIASGQLISITAVADDVFAQKMMGDGFAVEPTDGEITAPTAGKIESVADTKHAIMMTTTDGLEIMLHLGLDTVELKGAPFETHVKVGDTVALGDPLVTMDLEAIQAADKKTTVMTVVTNMDDVEKMDVIPNQMVTKNDAVATVTLQSK
ncbi:PTS sugar transporter subunit IIA [Lactiplantibacillus pentosus]|uniref:PTS sugar transporter subunit IIA n=1 Tax=Lactiplantibacillus pentosus TaxID=1589 RepID=UPI000EA8AA7F|nr:PTS glucose transporter subunit IIA [Lactiplantibacillus pentosus]AYG38692.1 PTS glucose transporter subunit IIA [Lactiplantibacillus pentosus]AYG41352.1 PTS glucose transporter subunit IIA [Lactiplantibacillus pentosus]MCB5220099.1 PTS glucose transporter subunit IIA [Lactiplantibacillus pentosus]MCJ8181425.1 PTS glucose transporter subunit IIA [Lactiplantibacillus pentosus]MCT3287319.1 PTS glucose transporter subunit IIA [Lactiplantibacillus pentosus]